MSTLQNHLQKFIKLSIGMSFLAFANCANAYYSGPVYAPVNDVFIRAGQYMSAYTLDCEHWYVTGNLGMSHLHDNPTPNFGGSVDENGPGWSAGLGYQFNSLLGTELLYNQYHYSRENSGLFNIAKTEHYAVSLAATGRYPLIDRWSVIGKLGFAYSYAYKVYTAVGVAKSASSGSLYYGLGLGYSMTRTVDFIAQWSRVRGNNYTGSADLITAGFNFAIV